MAAATIVMKLTGPNGLIAGESQVAGYEGQILLDDWKWSLDAGKDKLAPSEFTFSKKADRATVPLLKMMTSSELCPSAVIVIEEASMDSSLELVITLTDVQVSEFKLVAKVDDKSGDLDEDWTFKYANAKFEYKTYGSTGRRSGVVFQFDVDADPRGMGAPSGGAEDEILKLVPQIQEDRFEAFILRMREASAEHARRKAERDPADARGGGESPRR